MQFPAILMWKSKTRILLEERDFLRAQVAQLQNYILMTGNSPSVPFPTWGAAEHSDPGPEFSAPAGVADVARRMYTTEDEEDIEFRREEGLISDAEARRLLQDVGALNDEIT